MVKVIKYWFEKISLLWDWNLDHYCATTDTKNKLFPWKVRPTLSWQAVGVLYLFVGSLMKICFSSGTARKSLRFSCIGHDQHWANASWDHFSFDRLAQWHGLLWQLIQCFTIVAGYVLFKLQATHAVFEGGQWKSHSISCLADAAILWCLRFNCSAYGFWSFTKETGTVLVILGLAAVDRSESPFRAEGTLPDYFWCSDDQLWYSHGRCFGGCNQDVGSSTI